MRPLGIFVYLGILLMPAGLCVQTEQSNSSLTSTLKPPVERVFSRRKRWLLFPKGSNLKFTMSISKRLLALYPKGLNFNMEAAAYFPIPSARKDLIPRRFRKPTTKSPKPKGTTPLTLIGIPGSLIKYRAKPATRPPLVQRIDYNSSALQWSPSTSHRIPPNWSKYGSPEYLQKYQWSPDKQHKYVGRYENIRYSNAKWRSHNNETRHWNRYGRQTEDVETDYHSHHLDDFADSPHYHSYRGRRDLFDHFEGFTKILGIDMKSCVLRAMCDSKRFLLPPGYSMIQDIVRVIFTFPTINGLKDEYTHIMEGDYETCDAFLHYKCPLSIVDWFLNPKRSL